MNSPTAFPQRLITLPTISVRRQMIAALALSQCFALAWWAAAGTLFYKAQEIPWSDQQFTFLALPEHWLTPYVVPGFLGPPWTVLPLLPLHFVSLYPAALIQTCLYFALITLVIFKFGGNLTTTILALTSFVALDATLELNIDWLVCIGLLVPPAFSGPFLLIKPQDAMGIWLTFKRRALVQALIVSFAVFLISLVIWGWWPPQLFEAMRHGRYVGFNLAPMTFLSVPISVGIGLLLAWRAFRRRDPVFAILAWLFFVPYIGFYGLLLHFAVLAIRFPRFALLISAIIWIVYGRIFVIGITQ